jgi:membrane-associated protein
MLHKIWTVAGIPLILLAVFTLILFVWRLLDLPTNDELFVIMKTYFGEYGYFIMLISAIVEGFIFAGVYYPGSFLIFLGVILAENIFQFGIMVLVVALGLLISYTANFALGRYGWYKLFVALGFKKPIERAKQRLTKHGMLGIFLSYFMPNIASLTATAAGIMHYPFKKFLLYSLGSVLFWNLFWGIIVYTLGDVALNIVGVPFVAAIALGWIVLNLISSRKKNNGE